MSDGGGTAAGRRRKAGARNLRREEVVVVDEERRVEAEVGVSYGGECGLARDGSVNEYGGLSRLGSIGCRELEPGTDRNRLHRADLLKGKRATVVQELSVETRT